MKPENGDAVIVYTKEDTFEGILIPRPDIFHDDCIILKLDNGYNIGILKKRITKIEVIKKYEHKKQKTSKLEHEKGLPTISILSFGGTISSKVDYRTGGVIADYSAQDFVEMIPELKGVANIRAEKIAGIMSEDMAPDDWKLMAKSVAKELNDKDVKGVVVTQGTDTLHYSTAALSFFLRNLNKPVVFTGSQRSIDRGSSDAFSNLLCSVHAACKFDGAAVVTCMHGTSDDNYCILNRGTKVRKMHTSRRDAFRPVNELPLAKVYENGDIEILNDDYNKKNDGKVEVDDSFETKTGFLIIHPGINPEIFDFFLEKKYKGIVISATALGHVAMTNLDNIKKMIESGVAVVIATQSIYGRTNPYVYSSARRLSLKLNCIYVKDTLAETAFIKLGWVLGHTTKLEEVRKMMQTNYAGEMNNRIDQGSFLY